MDIRILLVIFAAVVVATKAKPKCISSGRNILKRGENLCSGRYLESPKKAYKLVMQTKDGHLVLYCYSKANKPYVQWKTGKYGFKPQSTGLRFQNDGNLVISDIKGKVKWTTNTHKTEADYLELQDDGNLVLYGKYRTVFWATNKYGTCGRKRRSVIDESKMLEKLLGKEKLD